MKNSAENSQEDLIAVEVVGEQAKRKLRDLCEDGLCEDDEYRNSVEKIAEGQFETAEQINAEWEKIKNYEF